MNRLPAALVFFLIGGSPNVQICGSAEEAPKHRGAAFRHNGHVREDVMETTRNLTYFGSFAAILIAANAALADNCSGQYTNVGMSAQTLEVATGHKVTFFVARGSSIRNDTTTDDLVGECGGYTLTMPDGKTITSGICTRKGKDEDSESDVFSMEPGAERGTWKQISGTGSFAGKNNSGWYQPTMSDGTTNVGKWGGNCQ
jgi:hypothetical protein